MDNLKLLAKNLRKIRKENNITIKKMSEIAKIPHSFLKNVDKLNTKRVKLIYLDKLCSIFNKNINYLFG